MERLVKSGLKASYSDINFSTVLDMVPVEPNVVSRSIPFLSMKIVDGVPLNEYSSKVKGLKGFVSKYEVTREIICCLSFS
jgi:hypothetical protein